MIHRKVIKRVNPKSSSKKEEFPFPLLFSSSFFLLYPYENMDVNWTYCDNHFTMYVNQTLKLYALNLYSDVCQLFFNKTGGKICIILFYIWLD